MKTTVIHHSADYDGLFCREIARKFLPPDTEFIGWDFADAPLSPARLTTGDLVYVLDLSPNSVFGMKMSEDLEVTIHDNLIWIDHHKSAIESHPAGIQGYRIDGVAACRLAWQWFTTEMKHRLPVKSAFVERTVHEPPAVTLAGEYDIWDHRGFAGDEDDISMQFGLDCEYNVDWPELLENQWTRYLESVVGAGQTARRCYAKRDADIIRNRSFMLEFEGLKFLALNTARCSSGTFAALDKPETGHDALLGFYYDGKMWTVSMYHAGHRKDLDLSKIAVKHGGGGHPGACGFRESACFAGGPSLP